MLFVIRLELKTSLTNSQVMMSPVVTIIIITKPFSACPKLQYALQQTPEGQTIRNSAAGTYMDAYGILMSYT